jgi:hypothetical protein
MQGVPTIHVIASRHKLLDPFRFHPKVIAQNGVERRVQSREEHVRLTAVDIEPQVKVDSEPVFPDAAF